MISGVVSNNNFVFGWCQWLLQERFTFIVEDNLELHVIYSLIVRWKERNSLPGNACLIASRETYGGVGMSMVFHCGRPHNGCHFVPSVKSLLNIKKKNFSRRMEV